MENPPFWMVFTRKDGIFMGYVSFREGNPTLGFVNFFVMFGSFLPRDSSPIYCKVASLFPSMSKQFVFFVYRLIMIIPVDFSLSCFVFESLVLEYKVT